MQRVALHARAHTAGEAAEHILIFLLDAPADRNHVAGPAVLGIDGGQDVVEKGSFIKIRVMGVRPDREEPAGQLEHVVDIACFCGAPIHMLA